MSKSKTTTQLTFAVTLTLPSELKVVEVRETIRLIVAKAISDGPENVKVHLTNKEVKYGA